MTTRLCMSGRAGRQGTMSGLGDMSLHRSSLQDICKLRQEQQAKICMIHKTNMCCTGRGMGAIQFAIFLGQENESSYRELVCLARPDMPATTRGRTRDEGATINIPVYAGRVPFTQLIQLLFNPSPLHIVVVVRCASTLFRKQLTTRAENAIND